MPNNNLIIPGAIRSRDLATSTIALSAYNSIVASGRPIALSDLYKTICVGLNMEVDHEQFVEAIDGLLKRKYISSTKSRSDVATLCVVDSVRRHVRWRDRSGDGWNNWSVQGTNGGIQRLEEVINVH